MNGVPYLKIELPSQSSLHLFAVLDKISLLKCMSGYHRTTALTLSLLLSQMPPSGTQKKKLLNDLQSA